ncbi:hypothetical protein ACWHLZ_27455, partial [Streptomyces chartreusis]
MAAMTNGTQVRAGQPPVKNSETRPSAWPTMRNERPPTTGCSRYSSCGPTGAQPAAISADGSAPSRYSGSTSRKNSPYVKKRQRRPSGVDEMDISLAAKRLA